MLLVQDDSNTVRVVHVENKRVYVAKLGHCVINLFLEDLQGSLLSRMLGPKT